MAGFRLAVGSLAVMTAAACAGAPEPAGSSAPATSAPPPPTAAAREFGVPARIPDEGTVTVRFVTYGDIDPDDEVPFGMIPDVQIAIIREKEVIDKEGYIGKNESPYETIDYLDEWWETVGGHDLGIKKRIPPGVRVQSTSEQLAAAPARFVTTGPDGTAESPITYYKDSWSFTFCALSPAVDNLIAGCSPQSIYIRPIPRSKSEEITIQIYFTHGYAIVEPWRVDGDRFQRFSDGVEASDEPAYLWVSATSYGDLVYDDDFAYDLTSPVWDARVAVVDSAHVNDWWEAISGEGTNELDMFRNPVVASEMLEKDWVRVVATGPDGLGIISLPPGDYLLCENTGVRIVAGCRYEDLVGGRHHVFGIAFTEGGPGDIGMSSGEEVENFLAKEDVKRLLAIYQDETSDD